jgi:hypothetical protein
MKTSDLLLFLLAIALVVGMILTAIYGKDRSRHGYGSFRPGQTVISRA